MAGPVLLERRSVTVGASRVVYRVAGAGPPVVLLHGLGGSGRWWGRNVASLAARFRVHLVDLAGFGESRGVPRVAVAEGAGLLAAWMDGIGLGRAVVVGHSMGGRIAADLAAEAPERVDRLVLVAAAIFPAGRPRYRIVALARSLRHTSPAILPLLAADAYRAGPRAVVGAARELLGAAEEERLRRVSAPTLVVWGEHDGIVPLAIGERLARLIPRAELAVIPGAGHNPMWDRPAEFDRLVVGFLSGEREPPPKD